MSQEDQNVIKESQTDLFPEESKKENDKKGLLLILLLIIVGVGIITYINSSKKLQIITNQGGVNLQIDPRAGEYVPEETETIDEQGVAIPGWVTFSIPGKTTEIPVNFFNPEANEGKYYLKFELRLFADNEQGYEVLYTSGLVEPGLYIQKASLSRELEEGNYNAIIHVQPYYMDEFNTPTNNVDMKINLIVK